MVCFVVRAGHRRRGIAEELLGAAVGFAASYGAPALEGYPIDPEGRRLNTTDLYVGTTGMFEREGFEQVARSDATSAGRPRWVMRRTLG